MVDVQRLDQLAYATAAAAAAVSEIVGLDTSQPVVALKQQVGRLQGPSDGCSYWGREIAILLRWRCQVTTMSRDRHHTFAV